jgi:glycosyltransferase involved in cell wall biosynthesis
MSESTTISVVIPTFNRRERLARVLRSLAEQDVEAAFEVVVISDGSTDGTEEYLRSGGLPLPVKPLFQRNRGPAAARNNGVERASGELVIFLDDDVVAEPGLLQAHLRAHRRWGGRAVVIGPMLNPVDHAMSPWIAWEQAMLHKQYDDMRDGKYGATARQFYTGNASVRREHLLEAGGFNSRFRRAEDIELAFRLDDMGLTFHFAADAQGFHYAERSYEAWKQSAHLYGRNEIVFARDCGRTWIYDFSRQRFARHHAAVRLLVIVAVRCPRGHSVLTSAMEAVVRIRRPPRLVRYALSAIYAIEFHVGMADEIGSTAAFLDLVRRGRSPEAVERPAPQ